MAPWKPVKLNRDYTNSYVSHWMLMVCMNSLDVLSITFYVKLGLETGSSHVTNTDSYSLLYILYSCYIPYLVNVGLSYHRCQNYLPKFNKLTAVYTFCHKMVVLTLSPVCVCACRLMSRRCLMLHWETKQNYLASECEAACLCSL